MTDREHDDQLLATATDRFERRLSEENAALRIEIVQQGSAIREEVAELRSTTREEITAARAASREDVMALRVHMTEQFAASRIEQERRHRELLKWAFAFWVGQAVAVAGLFKALA